MRPALEADIRAAWPALADQILAVLGSDAWRTDPAVVAWAAQCHHDPREDPNARPECRMAAINRILEGSGVEVIRGRYVDAYHHDLQAAYVNMGDTYDTTILYDHERRRYRVTSWGDWVERYTEERRIA